MKLLEFIGLLAVIWCAGYGPGRALALQADDWTLRQDIIWHKPNPMPESVRDRCTKAHEYLFLLAKSERYYFDSDAMKEPALVGGGKPGEKASGTYSEGAGKRNDAGRHLSGGFLTGDTRNRRSVWTITPKPYKGAHFAIFPPALVEPCILAGGRPGDVVLDPFMGSGTTAQVAVQHGRQYLGCELNPDYGPLQDARIQGAGAA